MSQVAMQLEGKVAGIDYIGDRRRRNVSTGELDGSYVTIITQSIYYEVDGTRRRLRVYFWDDRVKSIEWQ